MDERESQVFNLMTGITRKQPRMKRDAVILCVAISCFPLFAEGNEGIAEMCPRRSLGS